jgi:hypothetical protein
MATYNLEGLVSVELEALEDYYDFEVEYEGRKIYTDLNFETKSIAVARMDMVRNILVNLHTFDAQNRVSIQQNYEGADDDSALFYVEHHMATLDKDEQESLIDFSNEAIAPELQLLSKLHLVRIAFYPDSEDYFVTFDYSLGEKYTDTLLVVNTDAQGVVDFITVES